MIRRLLGQGERSQPAAPAEVEIVNEGPHSAEVYHDAARHFLDVQISTLDTLDTKSAQYLSMASLALPVVAALLSFSSPQHKPLPTTVHWLLGAAVFCYLGVVLFAWLASLVRALDYRPDIPTLKTHSEEIPGIYLKQWVANEYEASIVENKDVLQRKARRVGTEMIAFYIESICLSVAALLAILL